MTQDTGEFTPDFRGRNLIEGNWSGSADGFYSFDPKTNSPLDWRFAEAERGEVELAAQAAERAFIQYRQTSARQRADLLDAIATGLEADSHAIVSIAARETGLPKARLEGELARTCNQLRLFMARLLSPFEPRLMDRAQPERMPPKPDTRLGYLPLGPVAIFGAANFPLAFSVAGGDTASALAAACPVIVKGHPAHPGTSERVATTIAGAIAECNLPAGVFGLLQGTSAELSNALVEHPAIKAVGFTGSQRVARLLARRCAERPEPIPFYGELGSINPQFLLQTTLKDRAEELAREQLQSMMQGHGQFCTSPGLVVALKSEALERYRHTLSALLAQAPSASMLSQGILANYLEQTQLLSQRPGVRVMARGPSPEQDHHTSALALETEAKHWLKDQTLSTEIFGPCMLLVTCVSNDEMLAVANQLEGQLTASLHGDDSELEDSSQLIDILSHKVGRLIFNQMPTGVEVCHSMHHGGPHPASTDVRSTSVGSEAMKRFQRPICYQNMPLSLFPEELRPDNPALIGF
jgi:2,5-dioxopentanoate dehydrogenase